VGEAGGVDDRRIIRKTIGSRNRYKKRREENKRKKKSSKVPGYNHTPRGITGYWVSQKNEEKEWE